MYANQFSHEQCYALVSFFVCVTPKRRPTAVVHGDEASRRVFIPSHFDGGLWFCRRFSLYTASSEMKMKTVLKFYTLKILEHRRGF